MNKRTFKKTIKRLKAENLELCLLIKEIETFLLTKEIEKLVN